jgi:hypothetical protein
MAFEVTGKIIDILPVNKVSDKFRKREFVIEKKETGGTSVFIDYIKFQLTQDKCDLINESFMNEEVKISFNLRGTKWEKEGRTGYFTNLDVWRIEKISSSSAKERQEIPPHANFDELPPENDGSDLPF